MFDLNLSAAAGEVVESIGRNTENLCTLSNAELAVLRANQIQSGVAIASAFFMSAGGDRARLDRCIQMASKLPPDEIRHRATIAVDSLTNRKRPSLSQYAALLIVGRAEQNIIEEEIARRQAGPGSAH